MRNARSSASSGSSTGRHLVFGSLLRKYCGESCRINRTTRTPRSLASGTSSRPVDGRPTPIRHRGLPALATSVRPSAAEPWLLDRDVAGSDSAVGQRVPCPRGRAYGVVLVSDVRLAISRKCSNFAPTAHANRMNPANSLPQKIRTPSGDGSTRNAPSMKSPKRRTVGLGLRPLVA